MQKSLWRITAFPAFGVAAALFIPTLVALGDLGYVPTWLGVVLFCLWFFGLYPAFFFLIRWIV